MAASKTRHQLVTKTGRFCRIWRREECGKAKQAKGFRLMTSFLTRKRSMVRVHSGLPFICPHYSVRNALIGEMDAARPAGIIAATKAQIAREPAARISAIGSHMETP